MARLLSEKNSHMPSMKIPLLDLVAQYQSIKVEVDSAIQRVLASGHFILGEEVTSLETEVSAYLGVGYGVGVASGTDALILALRALEIGPGDEVIIPAYTFFATASAVMHVGAKPILVDIDPRTYCIDVRKIAARITSKTSAIIPVHLYGHPAEMDEINSIAQDHGLSVVEDNAQAFGAEYKAKKTGSLGDVACLSFFPSKNLGGYGDGGMVVSHDASLIERVKLLRTHGWKQKYFPQILGYNSRLDALQAAILRVKLNHLDRWNDIRRQIAAEYNQGLSNFSSIRTPFEASNSKHVYHLYVIRATNRNKIQQMLKDAGIASGVYYPQPLHLTQPCLDLDHKVGDFPVSEKASSETLALPIYPDMTQEQIDYVIAALKRNE